MDQLNQGSGLPVSRKKPAVVEKLSTERLRTKINTTDALHFLESGENNSQVPVQEQNEPSHRSSLQKQESSSFRSVKQDEQEFQNLQAKLQVGR